MKIKKGFVLRELAGEKIITGEGFEQIDFNKCHGVSFSIKTLYFDIFPVNTI